MIGLFLLFSLALCLIGMRWPALGLGLAAAADLVLMEGLPLGGGSVAAESLFFLYMACVPLLRRLVSRRATIQGAATVKPVLAFFAAFAAACAVSSALGGLADTALSTYLRLPLWCIFCASSAWLLRTELDVRIVSFALIGAAVLLLALVPLFGLPETEDQGGLLRVGYLNPLGHAFGIGAVLAFTTSTRGPNRMALRILCVVLIAGMLATRSRGAMAATAGALVVAWWFTAPAAARRIAKLTALGTLPLVLLAFAAGFVSDSFHSFATREASSNLYRYQIGLLSVRLFVQSPLAGVGLGNFEASSGLHAMSLRALSDDIIATDNDYARILAELGALGVGVLLTWCIFLTRRYSATLREVRAKVRRPSPALVTGASLGTFLLVLGLFESVLFSPTGWVHIGLSWTCLRVARR